MSGLWLASRWARRLSVTWPTRPLSARRQLCADDRQAPPPAPSIRPGAPRSTLASRNRAASVPCRVPAGLARQSFPAHLLPDAAPLAGGAVPGPPGHGSAAARMEAPAGASSAIRAYAVDLIALTWLIESPVRHITGHSVLGVARSLTSGSIDRLGSRFRGVSPTGVEALLLLCGDSLLRMGWLGGPENGERLFGGSGPLDEISAGWLEEPGADHPVQQGDQRFPEPVDIEQSDRLAVQS